MTKTKVFALIFVALVAQSSWAQSSLGSSHGPEDFNPGEVHSIDVHLVEKGDDDFSSGLDIQNTIAIPRDKKDLEKFLAATPRDRGPYIIEAVEKNKAWAEDTKKYLIEKGFTAESISIRYVPVDLAEKSVKKTFRDFYVPTVRGEVILGSIMTVYRGVSAFAGTYFLLGLSAPRALAYTAIVTALTATFSMQWQTMDNIFKHSWRDPSMFVSKNTNKWQRRSLDVGISEGLRGITGAAGAAHAVTSLSGQIELLQKFVFFSFAGSRFATTRQELFSTPERKFANKWVSFDLFFLTALLDTCRQIGVSMGTWFSAEIFHSRVSFTTIDALVLATYLGGNYLLLKKGDSIVRLAEAQERLFKRVLQRRKCAAEMDLL